MASPLPPPSSLNPNAEPFISAMIRRSWPRETKFQPRILQWPAFYYHQNLVFRSCPLIERYDTHSQPFCVQDSALNKYSGESVSAEYGGVENFRVVDSGEKKISIGWKKNMAPRYRRPENWILANRETSRCRVVKKNCNMGEGGVFGVDEAAVRGKTTLMIKNIPNQFERVDLLRILDTHCREENIIAKSRSDPCRSEYDFAYLPMEFAVGVRANLGYAFVNFTSAEAALKFYRAFNRHEWEGQGSSGNRKICEIAAASIQGIDALVSHFKNSRFPCDFHHYLPVRLSPPHDGFTHGRRIRIGQCIGADSHRFWRRKEMLMTRRES